MPKLAASALRNFLVRGLHRLRRPLATARRRRFYSAFVRRDDLCFDIGAHVGEKSALFLALGARVVAVEPQSACVSALERLGRRYPGRLTVVRKAVADEPGRATLRFGTVTQTATLSEAFIAAFGAYDVLTWDQEEEVEVTTLEALIAEYGLPDMCKIDTEGFEEAVLRGTDRVIDTVEFEFTRPLIRDAMRCVELLARGGDSAFNYSFYEQPVLELERWVPGDEMIAALGRVPAHIVHGNVFCQRRRH